MKHEIAVAASRHLPADFQIVTERARPEPSRSVFFVAKRAGDILFSVLVLPQLVLLSVILLFVNPIWNPGPIFFKQQRMGRHGKPFTMWKFRTMTESGSDLRDANAPLDEHRITPLGRLLRRTKLDELPNTINVLMGEMSLVGPRPDAYQHATEYVFMVPHYRKRFSVRPGITGLAQVRAGYADNMSSVKRKARYDSFYINNQSPKMELSIILATFGVVFSGFGQK